MNRVILHTGLHKTGTTFLQSYIFPQLIKSNKWIYNPEKTYYHLMDYILNEDPKLNTFYFNIISNYLIEIKKKYPDKNILISFEGLSGDLFSCYDNKLAIINKVNNLFPCCEVLLFFRFQTDWLLSCYKESIHEYHAQKVTKFLNYKNGVFREKKTKFNENGFQYVNALSLNFLEYIDTYYKLYGEENVHVFFQENLRQKKDLIMIELSEIFDVKLNGDINKKNVHKNNKSLSAFSCMLTIIIFNFFKNIGLKNIMPKPITFFGENRQLSGIKQLESYSYQSSENKLNNIALKNLYHFCFVKKEISIVEFIKRLIFKFYLIVIHPFYYPTSKYLKKITKFHHWNSWRKFQKYIFDRLFYYDWDFLKKHSLRSKLNKYYQNKNIEIAQKYPKIKFPKKYISND